MSELAGNIPRKVLNIRHLDFECNAHNLSEERESEICRNGAQTDEASTVVVEETFSSPTKVMSILQSALIAAEILRVNVGDKHCDLNIAEKVCVLTSRVEDEEDFSPFVTERLQCLNERTVEKLIGDESVNVEEILCESVGVGADSRDKMRSVCPNVMLGSDVETSERRFPHSKEVNQILREQLGSLNIISTPLRAAFILKA